MATKDVHTTGLSINATYDYSGDGPPVITGYAVTQSMSVLVRDFSRAGATISAAVGAGGNAVRLHEVRLQIGDVSSVREVNVSPSMDKVYRSAAFDTAASPASVPIRAGQAELQVTVSVVWSFA